MPKQIIWKSTIPAPELPESSLIQYLIGGAGQTPLPQFDDSLPAFIDGFTGKALTRGQLKDGALRLAGALGKLGLGRGSTVCIFAPNSVNWARAAFGAMAAGVTISPANAAYAAKEIAYQINNSDSKLLFIDPVLLPVYEEAQSQIENKLDASRVVLLCTPEQKPKGSKYRTIDEVIATSQPVPFATAKGNEIHDTAWLCYSSGTTGLPKGVMTTHYNMTSQLQAVNQAYQSLESGKDTVLGILPFSHIYGLTVVLLQPLTVGVPVVVLPKFDEIPVLSAIQKFKITHGLIVPPILIVLLHSQNVKNYDLSSLAFNKIHPHISLTQGYGMTETSPVITTMTSEHSASHPGYVGTLIPTFEARLVRGEGEDDAGIGERGELWVRSPSVMKDYFKNQKATDGTMSGEWYKTGDVLVRDADGWLKVVDRVKELIKYKGFQVPPAELEALLLQHEKVVDSGVVGVWEESQATELPRAYIVAKPGLLKTPADKAKLEAEVSAWVASKVANHKKLRGGCIVIEAIPKSPSGKILRKDLRVRAEGERAKETRAKL
ncbi:AMP binding protein [Trichosporon asahii var. asahii CBS 2479]|uniref:AMP binding protein n=1 Tax=Trichosporon asahii var. asahii (strain ATCC 90039 / CBS 2479 / JCM 2466 / KCTC 7840 / NBRC 103889/ NCYC 2677 / UAMH 7654) TaxID=1186058 RepID=J5T4Q2_TRIAS|nr:AMP binding protein [Trichosporon asahii var. asahii CBS 2479]EJT49156.1 AMP binding protein [Trichosporon asahii var. asahii CBS 2479]